MPSDSISKEKSYFEGKNNENLMGESKENKNKNKIIEKFRLFIFRNCILF